MDDLSILEARGEISFTFESKYHSGIEEGVYECSLGYGNLRRLYTFNLMLDQIDGRVWIGETYVSIDYLLHK